MCVHVCACTKACVLMSVACTYRGQMHRILLEVIVSHPVWALGAELWPTGWTVNTLNQ